MSLCTLCQQISPWDLKKIDSSSVTASKPGAFSPHHQSFVDLQRSSEHCELCQLICKSLLDNKNTPSKRLQEEAPIFLVSKQSAYVNPKVSAPQLCDIVVRCGERSVNLLAFAEDGCEAALSNAVAGRLPADPTSQESFETVSSWLQDCLQNHPDCRICGIGQMPGDMSILECAELPPRVLDVGKPGISKIRLIDSRSLTGQYVTLSHRWPADPSKHFITTKSSIDKRMSGFRLEEMPVIFQDAVTLSRKLGFRYLWIDSICIIQDDPGDWEFQSALMGQIYHKATITIMAATSSAKADNALAEPSSEGFLRRRSPRLLQTVKMNYHSHGGKLEGHWYIRTQQPLLLDDLDLLTRGWVLQEQLLSRRKIIYKPDQMLWFCNFLPIPEASRKIVYNFERFKISKGWQDVYFSDHWLGTAQNYSQRQLTFESDKLPALSGLASYLAQRHGQEYYAGIFSGSIAEGLLWAPLRPGCLSRPKGYIAPSWSWLSLNGEIKMRAPPKPDGVGDALDEDPALKSALKDVTFELLPEGQNPYGRLRSGKIKLTGWLKTAQMHQKEGPLMQLNADGRSMASFYLDVTDSTLSNLSTQEVECLYVLQEDENVLVLKKTDGSMVYERIGIASVDPEWFHSESAAKKAIMII